jgi:hypothetical protein
MRSRRALWACLLVLFYAALSLLFTYPLLLHLGTHHVGDAAGDAKIYLWDYWWVDEALTSGSNPFETRAIFYPIGIGLALHTLAFFQGVVHLPLRALVGEVAAPNLIVLWTFLATALATYALARYTGANRFGAFLAGMALAFCPYRLARLAGHYDLLGTEWMPLYVLLLMKLADGKRTSPWLLMAAAFSAAACGYTALSYLPFLFLFTLVFLVVRASSWRTLVPRASLLGIAVVALMTPLLVQMARDVSHWTYEAYPGADRYVADVAGFLVPTPMQTVLGERLGRSFGANLTEAAIFPGYLLLAGAVFGLRRNRLWASVAAVFFVLSLGSSLRIAGVDMGLPLPFWLISHTPLLDNLRAPSRLTVMVMMSLAVLFALTWTAWTNRLRRPGLRIGATIAAGAILVMEYLAIPTPLFSSSMHPIYEKIAEEPGTLAVIEIPGIEQDAAEIMFHQRVHRKPVIIGTAARVPREKSEYYFGLPFVRPLIDLRKGKLGLDPDLVARESKTAPAVARFLDLGFLVIDKTYAKRGVLQFVEDVLPVERFFEDASIVGLKVQTDRLPTDPEIIEAGSAESRQHFESGWLRPETEGDDGFRWANRLRSTLLFHRPRDRGSTLVLEASPLDGLDQSVQLRLDGVFLGERKLSEGWQEVRFELPPRPDRRRVERVELRWSAIGRASERDPRRLATRIRRIRFE